MSVVPREVRSDRLVPRRFAALLGPVLAAGVCAGAAPPHGAAADPASDPAALQVRLAELRTEVDALYEEGEQAVADYFAEAERLEEAEDAYRAARRAADRAADRHGEVRRAAAGQAAAAYMGVDTGPMVAWTDARGPQEALDRSSFLTLLSEHRRGALDRAEAAASATGTLNGYAEDALTEQQDATAAARRAKEDAATALDSRRDELSALIAEQSELDAAMHGSGGGASGGTGAGGAGEAGASGSGAEQGGGSADGPKDGGQDDAPHTHPEGSGPEQSEPPVPGGSGTGASPGEHPPTTDDGTGGTNESGESGGTGTPGGAGDGTPGGGSDGGSAGDSGADPGTPSEPPAATPPVPWSGDGPCSAAPPAGQRSNGRIPASELCPLAQPGEALRADAAAAFDRLDTAYRERFGRPMCVTDSYRPLDEQVRLFTEMEPGMAADPGTSTHGLGLAVDLCGGVEREDSAEHRWMLAAAGEHGWHNPPWARDGFEPWHWEFRPGSG
ncbi:M15 family metallopeptidase [Nocardiopsis potens]|uniref:M15 family metallopeptidase n=1 Tax=Nocardiopsis potens TaxID=1246458 RepID=UPI001F4CA096|nr:M15 family metallopeptidase [Nocardiopsis potens]